MRKSNSYLFATFLPALTVLVASMLIITACKKADWTATPETKQEKLITDKFFITHTSSNPAVKGAQTFFIAQNDKYHFTEEFIERIGIPRWDKALVYSSSAVLKTESAGDPATVVYIPFVRDSQNFVNATVLVKMTVTDTAYRVLCNWQYSEFGFESSDTSWSARDIFAIFSALDKSVFGHTKYKVKDGRIFGYPRETQLITTQVPQQERVGTESFILWCTPHTFCVTADSPSSNRTNLTTETVCTTSYTCGLVWFEGGGSGSSSGGSGTGGGSGGGGTGGTGSGGPVVPTNPCPILPRSAGNFVENVTPPCDTLVWEPVEIINNVANPCLHNMVEEVISLNCTNKISNFINSTFSNNDNLHLYFYDAALGIIGADAANTICVPSATSGDFKIYVTLNNSIGTLPAASSEYIAVTIFHETIHAWIELTTPVNHDRLASHELLASSTNINLMALALREMCPSISLQDALDLAWGGLKTTSAWAALSQAEKDRINQTNIDYQTLFKGTPCTL